MFIEWTLARQADRARRASGAVAGLVAITPAAGFVDARWRRSSSAPSPASLCYAACNLKSKLGYDDALDVFGVHGVGGTWGALATGLFATKAINDAGADGLLLRQPRQLWTQVVAVLVTYALAIVGDLRHPEGRRRVVGLRVNEEDEMSGLDLSQHSETAYAFGGGS